MFSVNGSRFLLFYTGLIIALGLAYLAMRAVVIGRAVRRARKAQQEHPELLPLDELTPDRAGYLQDGPRRARAAALLTRRARLRRGEAGAARTAEAPGAILASRGLIISPAAHASLRVWALALFGGLLCAGVARVVVGIARDRPIGLLSLLVILVAGLLVAAVRPSVLRTAAGEEVAHRLTRRYQSGEGDVSPAMGYALLGWAELESAAELRAFLIREGYGPPLSSSGGDGESSGGCGAAGCSNRGAGGCGGCGSDS